MRSSHLCGTIAATVLSSYLVYAESPTDSLRHYELGGIEVLSQHRPTLTVSKLPVPLSKLPMSINTLDGTTLQRRGIYDIERAAKYFPGVHMRTSYGAFQQMSVRGFDHSPIHYEGMRDERSTINSYPLGDLSSVERIEVLKGPAGVLFGHSAVGGAMNIVRKSASTRRELLARVGLGSYGYRQSTIGLGGSLLGPLHYYTALNYSSRDGYRNVNDGRLSWYGTVGLQEGSHTLHLRAALHRDYYATDAGLPKMLRTEVLNAEDDSKYLEPYQLNPYVTDIAKRYNNESDFMYHRGASFSGQYVVRLSDQLRLTDSFSATHDDIDYFSTEELTYPESDEAIYPHYYVGKNGHRRYIDLKRVQLTYPLRFSHMANSYQNQLDLNATVGTERWRHRLLLGYAVSYMRRTSFTGYNVAGAGDPAGFTFAGSPDVYGPGVQSYVDVSDPGSMGYMRERFSRAIPTRMLTQGIYLQDLMELGERLQLLLALRYDHYSYRSASTTVLDRDRKYEPLPAEAYRKNVSQAITYRAGVVYEPMEEWQLYASVSSFFRPDRSFYSPKVIYLDGDGREFFPTDGGEIFKPLKGHQTELGTRIELAHTVAISASAFYIRQYNNVKTLGTEKRMINGVETEMSIRGQVGTITSKGIEADITLTPLRGLMLTAGYGLTDIRYTKLAANPYLDVDAQEGNPLNYIPRHNAYSYGSYDIDRGVLRGLGLHYSVTYTGMIYRDYSRQETYPGYALLSAGLSYELAPLTTLRIQVDNILDRRVFSSSLGLQPIPNEPRTVQMSLTYHLR